MGRRIVEAKSDATLESVAVTVDGKEYKMCFDLGALSEAESALREQGHDVNLLVALPSPTLSNTRVVFAAAIRRFHPDISFEDAVRIPKLPDVYAIAMKIREAWEAAMPDAKADPPRAGEDLGA